MREATRVKCHGWGAHRVVCLPVIRPFPHSPVVSGPEGIDGDGPTLTSIVAG